MASSAVVALLLGQVAGAQLSPWKLPTWLVEEQAVYDARRSQTLEDLCRALGVEQEGYLEVRDGVLWFHIDTECGDVPFHPTLVTTDHAEGWFPGCSAEGTSCPENRVQVWREGETLVLRGAVDRLGACEPREAEASTRRFVPKARLVAAAKERAARLAVDLGKCNGKTDRGSGEPRRCWVPAGK